MNKIKLLILEKKLEKAFKKYVYQYDMNDSNISRKYFHSLRVKKIAKEIAIFEKLSVRDIELSILSGLLHDYGRFEQWTQYKTYNDVESIDHGDLAIELLFKNKEIYNFYKNESDYKKIRLAIQYHNKVTVPNSINCGELMLCNIIRDADKLDIFHLLIEDKNLFMEDNNIISKNVEDHFYQFKNINYKDVKSKSDKILLILAMFYDINSKYSFNYIVENKILERLFDKIENKSKYKKYFEHIEEYIYKMYEKNNKVY